MLKQSKKVSKADSQPKKSYCSPKVSKVKGVRMLPTRYIKGDYSNTRRVQNDLSLEINRVGIDAQSDLLGITDKERGAPPNNFPIWVGDQVGECFKSWCVGRLVGWWLFEVIAILLA